MTHDLTSLAIDPARDLAGVADPDHDADRELLQAWLAEYARKPNTLRAYAREARRFWLWWSSVRRDRTLRAFGRADLSDFEAVLAAPPSEWVAAPGSSAWRPFKGPMPPAARRQVLVILQSLFEYLVQAGHLSANPVRLVRDKGPAPRRAVRQVPSEASMVAVGRHLTQAATLPDADGLAARDAFVWQWIYWTGARRHELAHAVLGSVGLLHNAGRSRWWWTVVGKGEVESAIPLTREAVEVLASFVGCAVEGLADAVRNDPSRPLVPASRGARRGVEVTQIYESVCRVAAAVSARADAIGLDADAALAVGLARPHGLRAFRATHLFNAGVDARHVRRFMRHVDINTTLIYDHTEGARFHDAIP